MFDYLDFLPYLLKEQFYGNKSKMIFWLTKVLNNGKNERQIKGNINILNEKTNEKSDKYTSHLHTEKVIKDYQILKIGGI
ncbi:MAG: hypothetical protein R2852_03740 [Bacteroidia bacterium]